MDKLVFTRLQSQLDSSLMKRQATNVLLIAYVLSNILVEIAWNSLMAAIMYFCWYYPVGFVQNTTADDVHIRGFLVFLFLWMFMLFASTFSHFVITWIEIPPTAGVLASLMWMLCIAFCG